MDYCGIYSPLARAEGRIKQLKWLGVVAALVLGIMIVNLVDGYSFLITTAVVMIAEVLVNHSQMPLQKIYMTERGIRQGKNDAVPFANIRSIEFLPPKRPNPIVKLLWPSHPGVLRCRVIDRYQQKQTFDLSLYAYDDRMKIVEGLRHYCPHVQ